MNIVDWLIIGFILIGGIQGYRKGLINGIVKLVANIGGLFIAGSQYQKVLDWVLQYIPLNQMIEPKIYNIILPMIDLKLGEIQNQVVQNFLGGLPSQWQNELINGISGLMPPSVLEQFAHKLANSLTNNILHILAFGFVYFSIVILIHQLLDLITKPFGAVHGFLNRGGGFLLGGISVLVIITILAGLISPFLEYSTGIEGNLIKNSISFPYLLNYFNILSNLFNIHLTGKLLEPLDFNQGLWY